ncbi:MAG: hypothetical protein K2W85_17210 [Phycisphaerales bacterium]|nr:hypothetical protein [Phycisphaerales bacterium]
MNTNLTQQPDGSWRAEPSFAGCVPLIEVETDQGGFSEGTGDVNGDGRFNSADIVALSALLGSQAINNSLQRFDFDGDGTIDQDDVDFLQSLLACNLSAGKPGDLNGDNVINCADVCASGSAWETVASDANYRIQLDFDLDGDNDAADKAAFYAAAKPNCITDFNQDGAINTADIFAHLNAWFAGDPSADVDGVVGLGVSDIFFFQNAFFGGQTC